MILILIWKYFFTYRIIISGAISTQAQTDDEGDDLLELFMKHLEAKPTDSAQMVYPFTFSYAGDGLFEAVVDPDLFKLANLLSGRKTADEVLEWSW